MIGRGLRAVTELHVLHVIPSVALAHGGPSRALMNMEQALSERGIAVTTATTDDDGPGRSRRKAGPTGEVVGVQRVYFRKWLGFYKVAPCLLPWLWRHVQDYEVVHIHALFSFTSIAAAWVARMRGVPYVLRPLGTLTHTRRKGTGLGHNRAQETGDGFKSPYDRHNTHHHIRDGSVQHGSSAANHVPALCVRCCAADKR